MLITIDNLDGHGPVDYTGSIAPEGPITVQRALNKPSRCTVEIVVGAEGLPLPARRGRVTVTTQAGTALFTGYLATEPVQIYAGTASMGPVYRARLSAVSDEWLLDNLGSGGTVYDATSLGLSGEALLAILAARVPGAPALPVSAGVGTVQAIGSFTPGKASSWSENAALAASAAYAGYRALNGELLLQPAGATVHDFSDADGTLSVAELQTSAVRELANDVTITGAGEPAAYIGEQFMGDGTTTIFELRESAFRPTQRTLLRDSFNEPAFDVTQWTVADPGSHFSLTGAGLTMNGGNGNDGQTVISALDAVEMGGAIVAQLGGVLFGAASDGMLACMYEGTPVLANCFAGFRVRQNAGNTVVVPVVNGVEVGTVFTPIAGHSYTLRLRLHCVEMQRVMQPYYCMVDGVVQRFGSASGVTAPMDLVFELVDEGTASNTPATVLYDSFAVGGTVVSSPATCAFVLANATQLFGSIASVSVTRPGIMWVVSTLPSGTLQTRLIGVAGQGVDCTATYGSQTGTPGKITFFAGRVPVAGERITVYYRNQRRSVARLASASSIASESSSNAPGTSRWLGEVLQPVARSTADCEAAAQAVLAFATSRSAALAGSYTAINPTQDIWPGDVLAITSNGVTTQLLVRGVVAKDCGAQPEVIEYRIAFANDWATEWADGIGLRLSERIAANAWFPSIAASAPGQVLANLQQLTVTNLTTSVLQIDTGTTPPAGGGFEIRRRDWLFGAGVDAADLVMRSPVRSFSIPRASQLEQYFVRMYDASTPPVYSRFSSVVFTNAPVS
ncbi:hypothetical protein GOB94_09225 [Granulicella sp. 5B5]|uniref:hypothetical protein n=1 Tax=Granulicella sp. 5B5 TaxID=1617967 RepID=UPI0015F49EDE|nr:hypothetical protein [Granulicella sp. 5B5]QMV18842.1 hypothetical protein GOB94_09225 [Granulicella sp. 5B5]